MNQKKAPDWAAIEADYRAGVKTLRAMGKEYGVSHEAINKRAKKEKWTRDLSARIEARRKELVDKQAVDSRVDKATEEQVVKANAELQSDLIRSHRKDIRQAREIVKRLLEELGAKGLSEEDVALLANAHGKLRKMEDPKEIGRVIDAFIKSMDMGGRAQVAQRLVDAMKNLVALERQAFGIDKDDKGEDPIVALLRLANESTDAGAAAGA